MVQVFLTVDSEVWPATPAAFGAPGAPLDLEPAIAALSGLLFLGERLTGGQWLAIALVISASAGVTWTARRVEAPLEV